MTCQGQILEALNGRALAPKALYRSIDTYSAEAIDWALRGLLKDGQLVQLGGRYQKPGQRHATERPLQPSSNRPPRRTPTTGAALTSRQMTVALAAAAGGTIKEIAQALGISMHTTHEHLTRIYLKLGIKGKGELGERMREMAAGSVAC